MSGDAELGYVYLATGGLPTGDYYGGHEPGCQSLLGLHRGHRGQDRQARNLVFPGPFTTTCGTGTFQAILGNITVNGRRSKRSHSREQGFLLQVFDRTNGQPVWPIEERPVPKGDVPGEWLSPTQPFPTKPPAFERQGVTVDDLSRLHAGFGPRRSRLQRTTRWGPSSLRPSSVSGRVRSAR